MDTILSAASLVFQPSVLVVIFAASLLGLVIGAIPGLTAVMGTALLVPITFFMDPVPAIAAIVAMTAMAIFAGDVPGALLRMPGTPASAAYTEDAYAFTKAGRPELGLAMLVASSVFGGLVGSAVLILAAPLLGRFAIGFSSQEYFWLAILGLSCAAFIASGSPLKGLLSLLFGLTVATIGIDPASGVPRFTLGNVDLMGGISMIPAMIGLFAISEIIRQCIHPPDANVAELGPMARLTDGLWTNLKATMPNLWRGSATGTLIGALPGAGADIAAWMSYAVAKRCSKTPEKFGKGHLEGIAEAGASNNSALSGAWVPTLVFGIPGDSITAIVIGVLILKGMEPGPLIFVKQPDLIYAVFIAFLLANLLMLPLGLALIKVTRHIVRIPPRLLPPLVLLACIVGSYALNNSYFDVGIMLCFGVIGWIMEENGVPVAPAILGIVLGGMVEFNFMTTLAKADGNLLAFFERPVAAALGVVSILVWAATFLGMIVRYGAARRKAA
ncbi:tripartite tricarboxylate transporter permease [Sinorhizobium arboris]|uniref:tripartite tricarboxylate transporter permease n=1 Tax=Sinorhizobium arboris TaxID=76745 RepID=UPI0004166D3F|nr:tripartite tricarboxylate transporter permease [Sinorhizobium arboris]